MPNFFINSYKPGIAAVGKDERREKNRECVRERGTNTVSNICL